LLTLDDFITSSGKYPKRAESNDFTEEVRANLIDLHARVVLLLAEIEMSPSITSGFRPYAVNNDLKNAGQKSLHCKGKAVDLNDPSGAIKFKLIINPQLLSKYGLWMEHYTSTPGWCHLDTGERKDRPVRIFQP
jgi:uncharacterized protein YcbK (DUF882 family)